MILGDLDIWEQAFKEMDLSENVQFVSRGKLITEASQVEMFNKIHGIGIFGIVKRDYIISNIFYNA